jgi:uncharacterized membrane protein
MQFLISFLVSVVVFTLIDLAWLTRFAPTLYRKHIGHLMADKVNRGPALAFYLIFHVGLVYFVILPQLNEPFLIGLLSGALFGLVTYATYDLTNMATLKKWPLTITIIDLVWGTILTALSSVLTILLLGLLL